MATETEDARELENFATAGRWICSPLCTIDDSQWDAPGLSGWDVRSLVGHGIDIAAAIGVGPAVSDPALRDTSEIAVDSRSGEGQAAVPPPH